VAELPLDNRYRIVLFTEQDAVGAGEVIEMWEREGAVDPETAARRVHEVLFVGLDEHDELASVSTAYLERDLRLGMDLWFYRSFTPREHRQANLARALAWRSLAHLEQRYVEGTDKRGSGVMYVLENAGLRTFNLARWARIDVAFIGEDARGNHLRVRYFPGSRAPVPPE
jgi:hypothetical protein